MSEVMNVEGKTLNEYVQEFAARGYVAVSRTEDSAQLVRKKRFSVGWCLAWFLLFGVGVVAYLVYYLGKRDDIANLNVVGGRVSGYSEYTKIRTNRLAIGVGLFVLASILFAISAAVGGGLGTFFGVVSIFVWLASVVFAVMSVFGSRRREQVGTAIV